MDSCIACELAGGQRDLPGGRIFRTGHWIVEHCVGPLGLGTLIVKPERHVTSVADLSDDEALELGPLLRRTSAVASQLVTADQVYNCLWSHVGGVPVHIHYVVQPVTSALMAEFAGYGPGLQLAMFSRNEAPPESEIAPIAERARQLFASTAG
jgi:diadenosine tetraphosphate (Ap4A) HIT family hydrolase